MVMAHAKVMLFKMAVASAFPHLVGLIAQPECAQFAIMALSACLAIRLRVVSGNALAHPASQGRLVIHALALVIAVTLGSATASRELAAASRASRALIAATSFRYFILSPA
jgi:hypothetical protein